MTSRLFESLLGVVKTPPVVATFDAVPGWHAAIVEQTGMSDVSDPDTKYGKGFCRILIFPIAKWGIACESKLIKTPAADEAAKAAKEKAASGDAMDSIMGMLGASIFGANSFLGAAPTPLTVLPLDPREDAPTFLSATELFGVYPPSEGDVHEVLAKAQTELEAMTEKHIADAKKREAKT